MPELAGGADGPALQGAARDDARADSGRQFEQQQIVDTSMVTAPFHQGHHIGVVVDQYRSFGERAEIGLQFDAVPSAHDRRVETGAAV